MEYTCEMLRSIVESSNSFRQVQAKLGISRSNHNRIKALIESFDLDYSHFQSTGFQKHPWQEVLVDGVRRSAQQLRRALLESGREHKCSCGQGPTWNNKPLTLQVEHIDGNNRNNKPENVEFLCPNCHSQTPTYGKPKIDRATKCLGCNKKIRPNKSQTCRNCFKPSPSEIVRPSKCPDALKLRKMVWETPATQLAVLFGVSDATIGKWCKKHKIIKPGPGYWAKNGV